MNKMTLDENQLIVKSVYDLICLDSPKLHSITICSLILKIDNNKI